jgi:broad specificity phosphatase PhoE
MKRIIYLVRHCEYANPRRIIPGRLPLPLSRIGRHRAQRLRGFFADKSITKIYTSAVQRAQQTADLISGGQIPVVNDARLLESFSAYQGFPSTTQKQDRLEFCGHTAELGGETYQDIQRRMVELFHDLSRRQDGNIILVSHGDPLFFLYAHLARRKLPPVTKEMSAHVTPGYPDKGSIRPLELLGSKVVIKSIITV